MLIISERHRCACAATSGGDESAVLSCYYIKVRCLFKFTALAAGAYDSRMGDGGNPASSVAACARRHSDCSGLLLAYPAESSGWDAWVGKNWSAFLPLSCSPPSPLHRLLPGCLQGLPAGPSLHVTPCLSTLSALPSHTGAPPVPPPPIPAHTLGSSEQRKP